MKTHAIIPIFIPHKGCPHDCIFCNQKAITAHTSAPSKGDTIETIERNLRTIEKNSNIFHVEIAFYGGSFTAIPMVEQNMYLNIAREYKKAGRISKIHLSTRPDYINEEILTNLKNHSVDIIELGVQSFDSKVLNMSYRGHSADVVYRSADLVKQFGFTLGIQLMIGLPGDSYDSSIFSAKETVKIAPKIARLYPTVVIKDTELANLYKLGKYTPLNLDDAVHITKNMYKILTDAGINVIRVGLKSTENIRDGGDAIAGNFHPAFRQLVESEIAKEALEVQLVPLIENSNTNAAISNSITTGNANTKSAGNIKVDATVNDTGDLNANGTSDGNSNGTSKIYVNTNKISTVTFFSNPRSFSVMIGNRSSNKTYFNDKYPNLKIKFAIDEALPQGKFLAKLSK